MAKYNFKFKKKVVIDYMNGKGGYRSLCKEYGIPNNRALERWVSAYKEFGDEVLTSSRQKKNYSFEFKLSVVKLHLTTEASC